MTGHLSRREIQVLPYLARGLSNAEIGAALGISADTAAGYIFRMSPVLGARNRAEAVHRAALLLPCPDALPQVAS
jgi:DNA-binding NarL/FixJ family response regulator